MKVFCIENQSSDCYAILSIAISMQCRMTDTTLVLYCSDYTYQFVKDFYDFTIKIEHIKPEKEPKPTNFLINLIHAIKAIHAGGDDAFYINNEYFIINDVNHMINDESTSEVITIKRNVIHDNIGVEYPMAAVLFKKGNKAITWLEKYYEKHREKLNDAEKIYDELCEIDTKSMNDEELKDISEKKTQAILSSSIIARNLMPLMVSDDDSPVSDFFDGNNIVDMSNFFAKEDSSWKLNDFEVDKDISISRNGVKCCISGISPEHSLKNNQFKPQIMYLWERIQQIVTFNDIRLSLCQCITNKTYANRIVLRLPKKDLLGNWNRKNLPLFSKALLQIIIKTNYFNAIAEATNDYFNAPFTVLYDYKDESLLKPEMMNRYSLIALLNYNTELLTTLKDKYVYCGIYNPMISLLEEIQPVSDKTKEMFHFTDDNVKLYNSADDYQEYLDELKNYKHSFITDTTCKSHIVDCLALGVVPMIEDGCRILEIEDLLEEGTYEEKSDKCIKYFKDNLTAQSLGKRIINALMEYIQPIPVAKTKE